VIVHCNFRYATADGKAKKEDGYDAALALGQEKKEGGSLGFGGEYLPSG